VVARRASGLNAGLACRRLRGEARGGPAARGVVDEHAAVSARRSNTALTYRREALCQAGARSGTPWRVDQIETATGASGSLVLPSGHKGDKLQHLLLPGMACASLAVHMPLLTRHSRTLLDYAHELPGLSSSGGKPADLGTLPAGRAFVRIGRSVDRNANMGNGLWWAVSSDDLAMNSSRGPSGIRCTCHSTLRPSTAGSYVSSRTSAASSMDAGRSQLCVAAPVLTHAACHACCSCVRETRCVRLATAIAALQYTRDETTSHLHVLDSRTGRWTGEWLQEPDGAAGVCALRYQSERGPIVFSGRRLATVVRRPQAGMMKASRSSAQYLVNPADYALYNAEVGRSQIDQTSTMCLQNFAACVYGNESRPA
jgi:hypothetical protein